MRLLAILFLSVFSTAPREWRDSIRDVYINGKLDRSAQSLVTSSPRMYAVVCGEEVLFFDPASNVVSRTPKSEFTFAADRVSAKTTADIAGQRAGDLVKVNDSTYLAMVDGKTVLIAPHESKAGPMTVEELWTTAPVWRAIADNYEPDAATIERLRGIDKPVRLQIVLATWCGDSRQHVPRLLKSIATAANPNLSVELIGIGPDFTTPMAVVQGENITNVPTVIVRRDAKEIGRFVETPAGKTIEEDIADIVQGTPKPHPSRHERGALRTSGTYLLRDARRHHRANRGRSGYSRDPSDSHVHVGAQRDTRIRDPGVRNGRSAGREVPDGGRGRAEVRAARGWVQPCHPEPRRRRRIPGVQEVIHSLRLALQRRCFTFLQTMKTLLQSMNSSLFS